MVGAVTNMQFTYSFPLGFSFLYLVQLDATAEDHEYQPGAPPRRVDSWSDWSRWKRGLLGSPKARQPLLQCFKLVNLVLCA